MNVPSKPDADLEERLSDRLMDALSVPIDSSWSYLCWIFSPSFPDGVGSDSGGSLYRPIKHW
jgi:hypothetical protein